VDWLTVVQIGAGGVGALGIGQIVQAIARRRTTQADAIGRLNTSTLEWAEQLKADASEARMQAREARQETAEVRKEAAEARREISETHRMIRSIRENAELVGDYLRRLVELIGEPGMTIDQLRVMVGREPPPPEKAQP
jgi:methyl-accepting chemotaxis protein